MGLVLVTGGAGFIGSHLVDQLLGRGVGVRVLDNLSTGFLRNLQPAADRQPDAAAAPGRPGPRLELMVGDIRDEKLVRKAMRHVDCVFHLAALPAGGGSLTNPAGIHTVNVQGTLNVLQAATIERVRRVVFASCASVYGNPDAVPIGEDCPQQPVSVFAASKLAGEIYCRAFQRAHQLETVTLRYFSIYGPRQHGAADGAVVPVLIETLRHGRQPIVPGDGRAAQDFMYVEDAVALTLAAAVAPAAAGWAINVGSGQMTSVIELLDILKRLLRTAAVPRFTRPRVAPALPLRAQVALAEQLLGYTPRVSLVAGLARVVQSIADEPEDGLLVEVASREERSHV